MQDNQASTTTSGDESLTDEDIVRMSYSTLSPAQKSALLDGATFITEAEIPRLKEQLLQRSLRGNSSAETRASHQQ